MQQADPNILAESHGLVRNYTGARLFVNSSLENKGADVGQFLQQIIAVRSTSKHEFLLKLHSKSDPEWRCQMLKSLCGSPEQVRQILVQLKEQPNLSLIGPWALTWRWDTPTSQTYRSKGWWGFKEKSEQTKYDEGWPEANIKNTWNSMFGQNKRPFPPRSEYLIVAGSMFWSRSAPLLQDDDLHRAASRLLTEWARGYKSNSRGKASLEAQAVERIIPMLICKYPMYARDAPNKNASLEGDSVARGCRHEHCQACSR